ncbi:sensor histidine kinase [Luteolibacter luteus]|uniref:histidine kinase n=1 Tax=Luteolibacter luteus TaxID=2728835 RepID=A0A858RF00_9BACT|nr:ATP-binding protein [Luteolibacter luteus]QJE95676.1 GHKL domain-containing protein [Luteolibacter luteus]
MTYLLVANSSPMNAVEVLWLLVIGACLMLALVQVLAPARNRACLWVALLAISLAGIGAGELAAMLATTPQAYAEALHWMQIPVYTACVSIVGYVQWFLGGGRTWLGHLVLALSALCLAFNLLTGLGQNPSGISALREIHFLGQDVAVAEMVSGPRAWLAGTALLLLAAFLSDAAWRLWRKEERLHALALGGCALLFIAFSPLQAALLPAGKTAMPYLIGFPFGASLTVIAYEGRRRMSGARPAEGPGHRNENEADPASGSGEFARVTLVSTLNEFSGSLAHELNQPLAIILANAQAAQRLLTQSPPDLNEVKEILSDIVDEDRRAGDVIQRLRALLKREETKMEPLNLNELVIEVLHRTHRELSGHGIKASRCLDGKLPEAKGDRVQLQQVLLNLITNAAEAMIRQPQEMRRLDVSTSTKHDSVWLTIRDQGTGLPEKIEQIFIPFHTTKAEGLGMGLAISRSIMTAHGGHLRASSNPDGGAIFELELPALLAEPQIRTSPVVTRHGKIPIH